MWNESFFSAPQLKRDPLGTPAHSGRMIWNSVRNACVIFGLCAPSLLSGQQTPAPAQVRDSVRRAVDQLLSTKGTFGDSSGGWRFYGGRGPFEILTRLTDRSPDSVLTALVDCFTDSTSTELEYLHRRVTRGGVCYMTLHDLAYREVEDWPGNFLEFPTPRRLRAAQRAWREAIRRHWYSTL